VEDAKMLAARTNTRIGLTYSQANQTADCLARLGAEQDESVVVLEQVSSPSCSTYVGP